MYCARVFFLVLIQMATWVLSIEAQTKPDALGPLAQPGQRLMCRYLPVTPADSADMILQFMDEAESLGERTTTLAYDARGAPLSMVLAAEGTTAEGKSVVHTLIIRFHPTAEGFHGTLYEEQVGTAPPQIQNLDTNKKLPPGWNKTTPEEIARGRALAVDFWRRRCPKPIGSGSGPANLSTDSVHSH